MPRYSLLSGASFVARGQMQACVVVNMSPLGVRLHLLSADTMPKAILLHLPGGITTVAHPRWQQGAEAGFAFPEPLSTAETA